MEGHPPPVARTVTRLLRTWAAGDTCAREALVPLVYDELRRRAAAQLRRERKDHTLQPTALVHEVYLRLIRQERVNWRCRMHFYALASQLMRRVLVDHARAHAAAKRPDRTLRVDIDDELAVVVPRDCALLVLDRALSELAQFDERQASFIELSYFGGLTESEIGQAMSVSRSTVARELRSGRAWLFRRMTAVGGEDEA